MKKKTALKKKKRGLSPGLLAWMAKRKAAKNRTPKKAVAATVTLKAKPTRRKKRKIGSQVAKSVAAEKPLPSLKRVAIEPHRTGFW